MRNTKFYPYSMIFLFFIFFIVYPVLGQTVLVPFGSMWKYLDDGSDQGTAWRESGFDDGAWKSGRAKLGYGDDGEVTVVSYGPDRLKKYITTYFRHEFAAVDPAQYIGFILKVRYDDGAVVYLNGTEIMRANMPDEEIRYDTYAFGGSGEDECFLDKYLIRAGINVFAVEVHQSSPRSSDICFDLELAVATKLPDFTRKAPYLIYPGKNTEMQLNWQLRETSTCRLDWGIDTLYGMGNITTTEYGNDHQHTVTFRNLIPNTKYYYRVTMGKDIFKGSFRTAPRGDDPSANFMVYGDSRSFPKTHNDVAGAMVSTYTEDESFQSLIFSVGDIVSNGNSEANWDKQLFNQSYPQIQTMLAHVPFQSCMGNHEGRGLLFVKYLTYPFVDGRYWSFDYGPAHFVIFDQYVRRGAKFTEQVEWMKDDLSNTDKPWKFIVLHEPGWAAGRHENDKTVQNTIQPICEEYGVSILFAGHNHNYARAVVNGVHHVTTGGGGAPLYDVNEEDPYIVTAKKANHFCKVEINGTLLTFSVVTPDGTVIDQFVICVVL